MASTATVLLQNPTSYRVEDGKQIANLDIIAKFIAFLSRNQTLLVTLGEFLHASLVRLGEGDGENPACNLLGQVAISAFKEASENGGFAREGAALPASAAKGLLEKCEDKTL